jgi:acyl carrier protein
LSGNKISAGNRKGSKPVLNPVLKGKSRLFGGILEYKNEIRNFILENFMMGMEENELQDSDSLLDKGIIDSTGVLELVGFIEEHYQITIEDDELVPDNLDSVNNLVKFIDKKTK